MSTTPQQPEHPGHQHAPSSGRPVDPTGDSVVDQILAQVRDLPPGTPLPQRLRAAHEAQQQLAARLSERDEE